MKQTIQTILFGLDNSGNDTTKGLKYLAYIIVGITSAVLFEYILIGIMAISEGGMAPLRSQLLGMCNNAWWGGMNMSNYFLKPTPGSCDGITGTFNVGGSISMGFGLATIVFLRNYFYEVNDRRTNIKAFLTWLAVILIVTICRYFAGFSPKNPYWFWPDGVILGINSIVFGVRMYLPTLGGDDAE